MTRLSPDPAVDGAAIARPPRLLPDTVIVASGRVGEVALARADGRVLWRRAVAPARGPLTAGPFTVTEDEIVAPRGRYRFAEPVLEAAAFQAGDLLVVVAEDRLLAVDGAGALRWTLPGRFARILAPGVRAVALDGGQATAVTLDAATGRITARAPPVRAVQILAGAFRPDGSLVLCADGAIDGWPLPLPDSPTRYYPVTMAADERGVVVFVDGVRVVHLR